ncbi:hypothetical protein BCD48_32435 [Pseudofrankia sp. BMG5.36]|nr:hypothetical protein BCD48_32435 [Pseudofrankia sp. BMG5.36]
MDVRPGLVAHPGGVAHQCVGQNLLVDDGDAMRFLLAVSKLRRTGRDSCETSDPAVLSTAAGSGVRGLALGSSEELAPAGRI